MDWVGSSGGDFRRPLFAQTVALELQAMGVVDDTVEDGIGECRFADKVVPTVDRDLASDQGGAAAIAVLDNFEHVVALLGSERLKAPIIEDQQLDAAEGAHQSRVAAIAAGEREIAEHPRHALIEDRAIVAAGLLTECASQPALPTPAGPSMIKFCASLIQLAGGQRLEQCAVEATRGLVVDVLDRRLVAQPGIAQPRP